MTETVNADAHVAGRLSTLDRYLPVWDRSGDGAGPVRR